MRPVDRKDKCPDHRAGHARSRPSCSGQMSFSACQAPWANSPDDVMFEQGTVNLILQP